MELGQSLLAGVASGFFAGVVFLGLGAVLLLSRPGGAAGLTSKAPEAGGHARAAVLLPIAVIAAWVALGMACGLANFLLGRNTPIWAAGSPNAGYSLLVVAISTALCLAAVLLKRQVAALAVATTLVVVIAFGWLLPWLAL